MRPRATKDPTRARRRGDAPRDVLQALLPQGVAGGARRPRGGCGGAARGGCGEQERGRRARSRRVRAGRIRQARRRRGAAWSSSSADGRRLDSRRAVPRADRPHRGPPVGPRTAPKSRRAEPEAEGSSARVDEELAIKTGRSRRRAASTRSARRPLRADQRQVSASVAVGRVTTRRFQFGSRAAAGWTARAAFGAAPHRTRRRRRPSRPRAPPAPRRRPSRRGRRRRRGWADLARARGR